MLFNLPIILSFKCNENAQHCTTSLIIDNSFTMLHQNEGPLFTQDRQVFSVHSGKEVPQDSVITADGWNVTRKLITANGTMPGPDIIVHQNQKITVIVYNHLLSEGITIHWHGIEQFGTPHMDGTPFVTQCPILPGQSFNYTFTPRFGGSYFYHSHSGVQFEMGLFGALIVLRKRDPIPLERQHIVQIQEWNHLHDPETLLKYLNHIPADTIKDSTKYQTGPHSILINGKGEFENNMAPLTIFHVDRSKPCLFRLISVASDMGFLFSIPGVKLVVRETDGEEVNPVTVDKIIIFPGERYDIELDLKSYSTGVLKMNVNFLDGRLLAIRKTNVGIGLINMTTNSSTEAEFTPNADYRQIILNCPYLAYPNEGNFSCISIDQLESINHESEIDMINRLNKTFTNFLNFGFRGLMASSVNGRIFKKPSVSALTQPQEVNTRCSKCDVESFCTCSYSVDLESGSEIILVIFNLGKEFLSPHSIHIHGHKFQILKMGLSSSDKDGNIMTTNDIKCSEQLSNEESLCYRAKWTNNTWNDPRKIPNINFQNGVRKDTFLLPAGGYAVARIWATNPGVWFMHCHQSRHLFEGMAVMLNESFEYVPDFPQEIPICHSFDNTLHPQNSLKHSNITTIPPESSSIPVNEAKKSIFGKLYINKNCNIKDKMSVDIFIVM